MGIPPLVGFMGKLYVFAAIVERGSQYWWYAFVGAINAAIAAYYYARVLKTMMIDEGGEDKPALKLAAADLAWVGALAAANVVPILWWSSIEGWARGIARSLRGPLSLPRQGLPAPGGRFFVLKARRRRRAADLPLSRGANALRRRWALASLAILGVASCSRGVKVVHQDLAAKLAVADRQLDALVILFGTPAADVNQRKGLLHENGQEPGDRYVWSRSEGLALLPFHKVTPRVALLDLAPYPGLTEQKLALALNGHDLGQLVLEPERRRYRVALPEAVQRPGTNKLRLMFSQVARQGNPQGRQLAAKLYGVAVWPASSRVPAGLLSRGAPPPFTVEARDEGADLTQIGGSVLRYALRVPEGGELRFTPRLHPVAAAAAGSARLRVTLEAEGMAEREVWSRTLSGTDRDSSEVTLPLAAQAGSVVRLGLHVDGASSEGVAWGTWRRPRVLGHGPGGHESIPARDLDPARFDRLRRSLQGVNVVFVILDAAGALHFGCYGYPRATTPEIDRIAAEGVLFERAYTLGVNTTVSMGSVWTSRFPDEHRGGLPVRAPVRGDLPTLAERLGAAGVHTAGFVANPLAGSLVGLHRGFAEFKEVFLTVRGLGAKSFRKVLPPWLAANRARRFFAYVHMREPHFPYDPRPPFDTLFGPDAPLSRSERRDDGFINDVDWNGRALTEEEVAHLTRLYDGNLATADREVGMLRRTLEELGLWDRTLFIVAADHGEALYEHGFLTHNHQLYEESVRVPLVLHFPRGTGLAGRRVKELVDLLDVGATIADAFGLPGSDPGARPPAGRSLLPVALGAPGKPLVFTRTTDVPGGYSVRDAQFSFIHDPQRVRQELYDLAADPKERRNLARERPVLAGYYRQLIDEWLLGLDRGDVETPTPAELSSEQREQLKALGYVQP